MNQKGLTILGLMARSARSMGLGAFLQLSRDIVDFILLKLEKPPLNISLNGHVICGCLRHRSFLYHLSKGNYESFTVELFKKHLKSGMTVVDGGAHIGFYTLLAAQLVGISGNVYSFEPDPCNYQCLLFNIHKNHYHNVKTIQKALSNKSESVTFYQSPGTISSSIGDRGLPSRPLLGLSVKKFLVQSTTVDSQLENARVNLIKLDIEGSELLAINGMSKIIENNPDLVLFIEVNPSALLSLDTSPNDLIRNLRKLNFDVDFIDEQHNELIPMTEKSAIGKGNLYCKRA